MNNYNASLSIVHRNDFIIKPVPTQESMDGESLSLCSRQDLLDKFEELEQKWKTSCSAQGLPNILNIFSITDDSDLVPQNIQDIYSKDWKLYARIRRELEDMDMETESGQGGESEESEKNSELVARFARFQENIFYGRETLLCFMRMTNCNSAFPVPVSAEILFWHSPLSKEDLQPAHIYTLYLLGSLFRMRYRRFEGFVFEQIFKDGKASHAWKEKCDIKTVVRSLCSKETNFEMWKMMLSGMFEPAVKYLTDSLDMEFPDLKIKRRVWSFNDGIYDATDDRFWFYGQHTDDELVSCKIIEKDFAGVYFDGPPIPGSSLKTYSELETPLFDSIFTPQKWSADMIKWMFVFIGRLFYEVNEKDSWQVIPFLKGVAGSGKSTIIKVVQKLYNSRDIGVISNNIEKQFGLSTIFTKKIFIIPEMKGDFALDVACFQSMITGEELSMAVKHENPCVGRWSVPGILAGNESPRWEDKSGSISRRVVILDFPNRVPSEVSDPNLLSNIFATEIPAIIRKASLSYSWAVHNFGNSDIWNNLPPRILEEKKRFQYSSNALYAFVNSDRVNIDSEEYTLESIFISQLKLFTALKFPGTNTYFTPDNYGLIFADHGISVEECVKFWPKTSQNEQRGTYVIGCSVEI